jgi:hypothetical protein
MVNVSKHGTPSARGSYSRYLYLPCNTFLRFIKNSILCYKIYKEKTLNSLEVQMKNLINNLFMLAMTIGVVVGAIVTF